MVCLEDETQYHADLFEGLLKRLLTVVKQKVKQRVRYTGRSPASDEWINATEDGYREIFDAYEARRQSN
ncbi:hypothetical protein PENVUL_c023G04211 [Penicillium vulpinum]|uniref:Uncharacterized protein n=2 Tax=Penicillium vulpinum TaxID=29845 RepID=A0A1V6RVN0_9EURO|nr:hypothetical protein PENVUL_c023G04211 [Penicillium vulpinum]